MTDDPEHHRRDALIGRARRGEADDHEHEELALYVGDEERDRLAAEGQRTRDLGGTWLERTRADERVLAIDESPRVKRVRNVGLALLAGGFAISFVAPIAGPAAILAGLGLLAGNMIRTRIAASRHDPYRHVKR